MKYVAFCLVILLAGQVSACPPKQVVSVFQQPVQSFMTSQVFVPQMTQTIVQQPILQQQIVQQQPVQIAVPQQQVMVTAPMQVVTAPVMSSFVSTMPVMTSAVSMVAVSAVTTPVCARRGLPFTRLLGGHRSVTVQKQKQVTIVR